MLFLNSRRGSCLFLLIFFVVSLFLLSYSATFEHHPLRVPGCVRIPGARHFTEVPWSTRRFLSDQSNGNMSLVLAQNRTNRRDPLDHFNTYTGGWNIKNLHYWASVSFTAAPFFVIAVLWFVLFGLSLLFICLCCCLCPRKPYGYSQTAYTLSLIFLILFTLCAIAGCVVVYTGQWKFNSSTKDTLDYVVNQADLTVENLRNVSDYLDAAKRIGVSSKSLPANMRQEIDSIKTKINSSATLLGVAAQTNSHLIRKGLDGMRLALNILAALMLLIAFVGFLCSICGLQSLVYTMVIISWILVAVTFLLCGGFHLLHNVLADACVSMDEWVQNPTAHTALDDILPCVDQATAQETLLKSKLVVNKISNVIDNVLSNVANQNFPPEASKFYFNQSGPPVPLLCNPFNPDVTDRLCAAGEVSLGNASKVWKNHVCETASGICQTTGRLTPEIYNQMEAAENVSYALYRYGPFLISLEDCTFIRQTFTDISRNYCPSLRRYTQWIYIGLVLVSSAVMLSLIFWIVHARERQHRLHTMQHHSTEQYKAY